ncbi:trypsin alpha-3-like [Pollicipes pollicipes]|uniref:trypsin alpha-3-like n=1 Tax=Pollicipes pollicipes TaxID=41117 RepID=UPI001885A30F|nr:trypsin alpha-3-like [Pollicipes pollicipes]
MFSLKKPTARRDALAESLVTSFTDPKTNDVLFLSDKDKFQVVTGGTDLDDAGLQVRLPAKVVIADYDSTEKFNDLALIKTVEPLRPSTRLSGEFMQLAKGRPSDGTACLVLGWGTTRSGGSTVRRLQMALVTTQSRDRCAEAYRAQHYNIYDTMLCAGGGARDACQGDSDVSSMLQWIHSNME